MFFLLSLRPFGFTNHHNQAIKEPTSFGKQNSIPTLRWPTPPKVHLRKSYCPRTVHSLAVNLSSHPSRFKSLSFASRPRPDSLRLAPSALLPFRYLLFPSADVFLPAVISPFPPPLLLDFSPCFFISGLGIGRPLLATSYLFPGFRPPA